MTITADPLTAGIAADYAAMGAWLEEHPAVTDLLSHIHSIPLRGHTPAERKAELEKIALDLGAEVEPRGPGYYSAAVRFGRVVIEAHHSQAAFVAGQRAKKAAA